MGGIHRLVTENAIDGEVFFRLEAALLVGQFMQHLCADCSGVCTKKVFHGLFLLENATISYRAEPSGFVGPLYHLEVHKEEQKEENEGTGMRLCSVNKVCRQ